MRIAMLKCVRLQGGLYEFIEVKIDGDLYFP